MEQSSGTENESRPAGGVGDAATPSIDGPGRDRSCGSGSRPAEPTLLRAETYDQAQKVGAPVSLSQILGRAPVSSRAPCAAAGPTAPVASSADSTAARSSSISLYSYFFFSIFFSQRELSRHKRTDVLCSTLSTRHEFFFSARFRGLIECRVRAQVSFFELQLLHLHADFFIVLMFFFHFFLSPFFNHCKSAMFV